MAWGKEELEMEDIQNKEEMETNASEGSVKETEGAKEQTFEEVLKNPKYQAEFDKKIAKALETKETKLKAEIEQRIIETQKEAERLANMSAEQKAKELEKQNKEAMASREKELNLREMKLEAINIMSERGLPIKLVDFVTEETAEKTTAKINALEEAFNKAVEEHTNKRLKGSTPKDLTKNEPKDPLMEGFEQG